MKHSSSFPTQETLHGLSLSFHEGQCVVAWWRGLLPFHLHLRLRSQLQLDSTGVDLGRRQQLLHAFHLLAVKCDHRPPRDGLGRDGSWGRCGGGARRPGACPLLRVGGTYQWAGASPASTLTSNLLGQGSRSGRGHSLQGRGGRLLYLGLAPGATPSRLSGVLTGLVIIILGFRLFCDDCDFLTHLRGYVG